MSSREFFRNPAHNNPSAHRTAADTTLYPTNHCVDRLRQIAPHLAERDGRELRFLILREIEAGQEATPEQLNMIRQSRARVASTLSGGRKFQDSDRIIINNYVAYVTEQNSKFGPLVVTCYEVEYLRTLEPQQPVAPEPAAVPEPADAWPWEWAPVAELLARDPYVDLLAAYRNGDSVMAPRGGYVELTGEPGAIMFRAMRARTKWLKITEKPRAGFAIVPNSDVARVACRKERKGSENERRYQRALAKSRGAA